MVKEIDLKKLKFIPTSEVPERIMGGLDWGTIFSSIPEKQALVLSEDIVNPSTVKQAVLRFKRRGKFLHLRTIERSINGKTIVYVTNETGK